MGTGKRLKGIALAVLAATTLMSGARAEVRSDYEYTGVRLQVDNDLFAGRERDRDYTGGLAVAISGTAARDGFLSLDPLLARIDALIGPQAVETHHARQFGYMAFTPQDIISEQALHNDRPYASLLFTSNGRVRVVRRHEDARARRHRGGQLSERGTSAMRCDTRPVSVTMITSTRGPRSGLSPLER